MVTRGQDSIAWKESRKYRVTSTNVKNVCMSTDFERTAFHILNPLDLSSNIFTNRGKQDEEKGVQYLLNELKIKELEAKAFLVGFITHPKYNWLGASPDRLLKVNNEWCLVEIKNWYVTRRQNNIEDLKYLDKNKKITPNSWLLLSNSDSTIGQWIEKMLFCGARNRMYH